MNSKSMKAFNDELEKIAWSPIRAWKTWRVPAKAATALEKLIYKDYMAYVGGTNAPITFGQYKAQFGQKYKDVANLQSDIALRKTEARLSKQIENPAPTFYDKHKKKLILGGAALGGGYLYLNKDSKKSQEEELQEAYAKLQQAGYLK